MHSAHPMDSGCAWRSADSGATTFPGRRAGSALVAMAMLALGGCISHEARIVPPAPSGSESPAVVLIGSVVHRDLTKDAVFQDNLPLDIPVSAWRREADGSVTRYEGRATTPLPWWQRFPADLVSDAIPVTFVCPAQADVVLKPLAAFDQAAFLAAAHRDGYARLPGDDAPAAKEQHP